MKAFFTKPDFDKVKACAKLKPDEQLSLASEMARFNTLATISCVRSGHVGASLSAIEMLVALYHDVMRFDAKNPQKPDRDIFILSKGHAAAGQYAVLASAGFFGEERLLSFRKFKGLQGHVDLTVPGIDANTGSLGMGISKAKGYAWAFRQNGTGNSAFVMVGDGELQEGQNWEAIQSAGFMKLDNLWLIVDRNQVQTDVEVSRILDLGDLAGKLVAFGWEVETVDGNSVSGILAAFGRLKKKAGKPRAIIANTIKGKGVSFMEHPAALAKAEGYYKWHAGIPNKEEWKAAYDELVPKIRKSLENVGISVSVPEFTFPENPAPAFSGKQLKPAFSQALMELVKKKQEIIAMDADLCEDCGLREFSQKNPQNFVEVGIAEQDMVSMAGGLALAGKLPIVGTYTAFLTSRSNEQIFNNCSEGRKIIYIGHLAGILPAKPGKSHQGIRDISLLRSIPNLLLCAPCNQEELKAMMGFLVLEAKQSSYMRLEHCSPRKDVGLPKGYTLEFGKGAVLADGKDAVAISYGPLMLSETLLSRDELAKNGISLKVVNLPWLNNIDEKWLLEAVGEAKYVFCIENHYATGGQGEEIRRILDGKGKGFKVTTIGVEGFGQSGDNDDILRHYGLHYESIAAKIMDRVKK